MDEDTFVCMTKDGKYELHAIRNFTKPVKEIPIAVEETPLPKDSAEL